MTATRADARRRRAQLDARPDARRVPRDRRRDRPPPPTMPYLSNLTGRLDHRPSRRPTRSTGSTTCAARFASPTACARCSATGPMVTVELGPGPGAVVVRPAPAGRRPSPRSPPCATRTTRHADTAHTLPAFARQWVAGMPTSTSIGSPAAGRRRLRLPTYPFQHQRHWIEPGDRTGRRAGGRAPTRRRRARRRRRSPASATSPTGSGSRHGPTARADARRRRRRAAGRSSAATRWVDEIAAELRLRGARGRDRGRADAPARSDAASAVVLVGRAHGRRRRPRRGRRTLDRRRQHRGEVARRRAPAPRSPSSRAARPTPAAWPPVRSTRWRSASSRVAPREYPDLRSVLVDLDPDADRHRSTALVDELRRRRPMRSSPTAAGAGLIPTFERRRCPTPADGADVPRGGHLPRHRRTRRRRPRLARHLATTYRANLVVVSSTPVPEGDEREQWLADPRQRRRDEPPHPAVDRARAAGTKVAVVDGRPRRPGVGRARARRGRAHGRPLRRRRPRRRAAPRPADRAGHRRGPGGRARRQGARRRSSSLDELRRRGAELLVLMSSTSTVPRRRGPGELRRRQRLPRRARRPARRRSARRRRSTPARGPAPAWRRRWPAGCASASDDGEPVDHPVLTERHAERDGAVELPRSPSTPSTTGSSTSTAPARSGPCCPAPATST